MSKDLHLITVIHENRREKFIELLVEKVGTLPLTVCPSLEEGISIIYVKVSGDYDKIKDLRSFGFSKENHSELYSYKVAEKIPDDFTKVSNLPGGFVLCAKGKEVKYQIEIKNIGEINYNAPLYERITCQVTLFDETIGKVVVQPILSGNYSPEELRELKKSGPMPETRISLSKEEMKKLKLKSGTKILEILDFYPHGTDDEEQIKHPGLGIGTETLRKITHAAENCRYPAIAMQSTREKVIKLARKQNYILVNPVTVIKIFT